ncbi:MAG TPA: hypothetical protein VM695_13160 [Phycisphaerae bacterium]|nr:hypothetical protein [Phycisphaerae bacterium]
MTLTEALEAMLEAGFTQVQDNHSRFPKDIRDVLGQAQWDLSDYTPDPATGHIAQNHDRPCNHFVCS